MRPGRPGPTWAAGQRGSTESGRAGHAGATESLPKTGERAPREPRWNTGQPRDDTACPRLADDRFALPRTALPLSAGDQAAGPTEPGGRGHWFRSPPARGSGVTFAFPILLARRDGARTSSPQRFRRSATSAASPAPADHDEVSVTVSFRKAPSRCEETIGSARENQTHPMGPERRPRRPVGPPHRTVPARACPPAPAAPRLPRSTPGT